MPENTNSQSTADNVDIFINQLLDAKHLSGETPESRQIIAADLRRELMEQIDRAMIGSLNSSQLEQLSKLLDDDSLTDDQVRQFFVSSGVDSEAVVFNTMVRFRAAYLGNGSGSGANQMGQQ